MDNWIKVEVGNVIIIHHSTSSVIEIKVEKDEATEVLWMDYYQFDNLKKAIEKTNG